MSGKIFCTKCGWPKDPIHFRKDGKVLKTCDTCRGYMSAYLMAYNERRKKR